MPVDKQKPNRQGRSDRNSSARNRVSHSAKVYVTRDGGRYVDSKEFINSRPAQQTLKKIKELRPRRGG